MILTVGFVVWIVNIMPILTAAAFLFSLLIVLHFRTLRTIYRKSLGDYWRFLETCIDAHHLITGMETLVKKKK